MSETQGIWMRIYAMRKHLLDRQIDRERERELHIPSPLHHFASDLGLLLSCTESWSDWSEWSPCDSSGSQVRLRHCDVLFPTGNQCSGNSSETRACLPISNFIPGEHRNPHTYTLKHLPYRPLDKQVSSLIDKK